MSDEAAAMQNKHRLIGFFEKERAKLVSYVRKNSKESNGQEAEDLVQDVFLRILENVIHPIENLAAYVYRSLDHRMTDLFRSKASSELSFDALQEESGGAIESLFADLRNDTQGSLERNDLLEKMYLAIDRLPEAQKAVIIATELEEWTFEELSELWDEPLGTLLSRKHRAIQTLKKHMKKLL